MGVPAPSGGCSSTPYPSTTLIIPYTYVTNAVGVNAEWNRPHQPSVATRMNPSSPCAIAMPSSTTPSTTGIGDKRDDARSQEAKAEYTDIMLRIVDDQDFGAPTKAHIHPANIL